MENALIKFLVEIVEAVVEGEDDQLRQPPSGDIARRKKTRPNPDLI